MTGNARLAATWTTAKLGDLCAALQYGYTASAETEPCGPRFLRITDIQDGTVAWPTVPYCKIEDDQIEKFLLHPGDVVFARTGGTVGKSYIITSVPAAAVFASYLIRLTPHPQVYPTFLYHFFQSASYWEQIGFKKGGLQGNVNATTLSTLDIPLGPLNEQRRVVAKIEELFSELDKGVEALTTARQQLAVYRQAILKHAFEGKLTDEWRTANLTATRGLLATVQAEREARNPKKITRLQSEQHDASLIPQVPDGWVTEYLGNLNVEIFDGPFGSHLKTSDYVETGIRVIRLENIGQGHFIDEKQSFVSEEKYKDIQKHTVVPGDIVLSSFVTEAIRSALVPIHIPFAVNKADCFAVRFFGKTVNAKFVQLFFQSRNAFKQIEGMIHGVGRPRINTSQLKELAVPLCAPVEQALIVDRLDAVFSETDALETTIDTGLAQLAALRQSILKQAFSGQLVAQDPKDEPASMLLERVRGEHENETPKMGRNDKRGQKEAA